jgi:tetratricopeptide (TPR) repeat protein
MNHRTYLLVLYALLLPSTVWAFQSRPVDKLVAEGMTLKSKGKHTEAIQRFKQALTSDPKNESALVGLGRTYGAKGDYKSAEKTFKKAIKLHRQSVNAHRYLALTFLRKNNLKDAEKYARKATKIAPKQWDTHHALAEIQLARRKWNAAIKSEKKVLKLDKKNLHGHTGLIAAYQAKYQQTLATLQRKLRQPQGREESEALQKKMTTKAMGNLKKAAKYARSATQIVPNMIEPRIKLAELLAMQGKRKKGLQTLKDAEKVMSQRIQHIALIATAFTFLGSPKDAARLYQEHLKRQPDSAIGHAGIAEVLVKMKKLKKAHTHATKAAQLAPTNPLPHQILGVIAALKKDTKSAEAEYRLAINYAPKALALQMRLDLAMLLIDMGKDNKAIAEFETVLKKAPKTSRLSRGLCQLYRKTKTSNSKSKKVCTAACAEVGIAPADCLIP